MQYWLMKSEPETFSIDDLKSRPKKTEAWDGVRNYQARNFMRDDMKKGDPILFYHSNCETPGIVGIAEVAREAYPDHTAQDPKSRYYDPKATSENPRWFMVDVKFVKKFPHTLSLVELKANPALKDMLLVQKGSRLSVMPVKENEWKAILKMVS
jgi:predicted RNA-binding protein with PUA-like domain